MTGLNIICLCGAGIAAMVIRHEWQKHRHPPEQQFCHDLLGNWTAANGTFSMVMDEDWTFLADGTGTVSHFGTFHSHRGETQFEWKPEADRTFSGRVITLRWLEFGDDDEVWEELEEEDWFPGMFSDWQTVRYDFSAGSWDSGLQPALYSPKEGVLQPGFWFSEFSLSYCKPRKQGGQQE